MSLVNKGLRSFCAKRFQVHLFRTICLHRINGSLLKVKSVQNNITQRIQTEVSHLCTHTRRWRRILVRLLLRCYVYKVMLTLYQEWGIRSCSHFVVSTKCEQQRHRTGTSRLHNRTLYRSSWSRGFGSSQSRSTLLNIYFRLSGFQSSFAAYSLPLWSKYRFALHQSVAQNLIRQVTLSFGDLRGTAALCYTNRAEITVQKLSDVVWTLP